MMKDEAERVLAEVVAAHPGLKWCVAFGRWVDVFEVAGEDVERGRRVVVSGMAATCWLEAPHPLCGSSYFRQEVARSFESSGYGHASMEALARALEGFGERWESDAANRVWWAARLRERREELEAEVAELGEAIDALEVINE